MLLHLWKAQIGTRSPPPDPRLRIRYMIKNPFIYKPVFEAYKTRKTAPQAYKKPQDSIPKFVKKRFLRKVDVCNTFHAPCENDDLEVANVEKSSQKSLKK